VAGCPAYAGFSITENRRKHPVTILLMETSENQQNQLISILSNNFKPAETLSAADLMLTTEQIQEKLKPSLPNASLDSESLYDTLLSLGYHQEDVTGEMDIRWLLRAG